MVGNGTLSIHTTEGLRALFLSIVFSPDFNEDKVTVFVEQHFIIQEIT